MHARIVRAVATAIVVGFVHANAAHAQDQQRALVRPVVPFLEGTDVFWSNEDSLVFEAALFPHLVAWQNYDDLLDARRKTSQKRVFWAFSGTPAVRLRMFKENSAPVRTPSYMPRLNVQAFYSAGFKCGNAGEVGKDANGVMQCGESKPHARPSVVIWEFHGIVGHHSNGQEGCLYDEQSRANKNAPCLPSFSAAATPGTVNNLAGSFSTNYLRGGFNFRMNWLGPRDKNGTHDTIREFTVGAELQRQFHTDPEVRPFYSRRRFSASISGAQRFLANRKYYPCKARLEESGGIIAVLDRPVDTIPRVSRWIQTTCVPSARNGGWGFFVRYYHGQDYYNLGFLEKIRRIQAGVTFNQNGFFRFNPPSS